MISVQNKRLGGVAVKALTSLAAGALLLASAGVAAAQPQNLTVGGTAGPVCWLPDSFTLISSTGADTGTFSGNVWQIPSTTIANTDGSAVTGDQVAVRISGQGFCNTSHEIQLRSTNGSLRRNGTTTPPPGFANTRPVEYDAHWANGAATGNARRYGPGIYGFRPPAPGSGAIQAWYIDNDGVPGSRPFDVRLAVNRDGTGGLPLVAGTYSDTVRVTLVPLP